MHMAQFHKLWLGRSRVDSSATQMLLRSGAPFYQHGSRLTPAWINNCMHYNA